MEVSKYGGLVLFWTEFNHYVLPSFGATLRTRNTCSSGKRDEAIAPFEEALPPQMFNRVMLLI